MLGFDLVVWCVIGAAVVIVAYAAAADVALALADRREIRKLSEDGAQRAVVVERLLADPGRLFLVTMLLRGLGFVAAGAGIVLLLPAGTSAGGIALAVVGAWLALAAVQIAARVWVAPASHAAALRAARSLQAASVVLWPVIAALHWLGRLLGGEVEAAAGNALLSEGGLRLLLEVGEQDIIHESEKQMIARILEMDETVAREVMVPRMEVVAIEAGTSLAEALDVINAAGHSRIPVYQDDLDQVAGFLYAKDLLRCFQKNQYDVPISSLLRPAYFVPVSKKVNALLREMQKRHVHVAIVVDEYGGTAGLVTIEDIIEEIVGEIQDEYDAEEGTLAQPIGQGAYLLNARYDLYSLSKLLDTNFPDEDADTLAGLIYSVLGNVPELGEVVEVGGWRFTVLSLDGRRIDQVRAEPLIYQEASGEESPAAQDASPLTKDSSLRYSTPE